MVQTVEVDATRAGHYHDLALYWGESLHLDVVNRPAAAQVYLTIAQDRHAEPMIELGGSDQIALTTAALDVLSEGEGYYHNVWLREAGELTLLSHGRFTARASIAPRLLSPAPLALAGTPPVTGQVGQAYGFVPVIDGGTLPYAFTLVGAALPQGLSLDPLSGVISGVPELAGDHSGIVLRVTDAEGGQADLPGFDLTIAAAEAQQISLQAGTAAPKLIVDGDSIMANAPGTRVVLEQYAGHLLRLPEGYQRAIGGQTAQDILDGIQGTLSLITPGETIVVMGPIGANQAAGSSTFGEISAQMEEIYSTLLDAGAVVVAVPTLPDEDSFGTNAEKDQLRDVVYAFDHPNFHAVDIGVADRMETGAAAYGAGTFDPYAMKNDQSHPNGTGARFLADRIATVIEGLVSSDIFAAAPNLLSGSDALFGGSRAASSPGILGAIPTGWDLERTGSGVDWTCAKDGTDALVCSVTAAAAPSVLTLRRQDLAIGGAADDIFDMAVEVEIAAGASGLRGVRVIAEGGNTSPGSVDFSPGRTTLFVRSLGLPLPGAEATKDFRIQLLVDTGATLSVTFKRATVFAVGSVAGALSISGSPATTGQVDTAYAFTPTVTGGLAPYGFDLASGSLPEGLSLNTATGAITGTPTIAGTQSGIALRVTDAAGATAVLSAFSLTIAALDAPVNTAPPVIDNTVPTVGDTLTATTGSWTNSPAAYAYQWRSSGSVIAGATSANYTVQPGDVAQTLRVEVVASNAGGDSAVAASAETSAVTAASGSIAPWDSSLNNATDLSYSDSDRVVTSSAGSDRHTRGTQSLSGKRYFEVAVLTDIRAVGIADETITALSGKTNGLNRSFWSGTSFVTDATTGMSMTFDDGDAVQVAVDVDADLIWVRKNGSGDWNGSSGADPATGTGGFDISGMSSGTLYAYVSTKAGGSARLDGTADRFAHTPPTGFDPLG
ncbi:putative Ig domain-containing protein [Pseudooceanicola sp.]|uniref:putative Ig domain-containing protein n=1 Tax=Pseudooceanicola sp. TaxID=1914328 RepID=UPI0035C69443